MMMDVIWKNMLKINLGLALHQLLTFWQMLQMLLTKYIWGVMLIPGVAKYVIHVNTLSWKM